MRAIEAMRLQLISGRLLLFRFVRAQDGRGAGGSEEKHGEEEKRHEGKGEFFDNARTGWRVRGTEYSRKFYNRIYE